MTGQTSRLLVSGASALAGCLVGLLLWGTSYGAAGLLLISFACAPCFFWPMSKSTLSIAMWSYAFCIGEIVGLNTRYAVWSQKHGGGFDLTYMKVVVFEIAMMFFLVLGMVGVLLLLGRLFPSKSGRKPTGDRTSGDATTGT